MQLSFIHTNNPNSFNVRLIGLLAQGYVPIPGTYFWNIVTLSPATQVEAIQTAERFFLALSLIEPQDSNTDDLARTARAHVVEVNRDFFSTPLVEMPE